MTISALAAWQIYDSRGHPTVEAEVTLANGIRGRGVAPSGASTGQYEALELRDGDPRRFRGRSVFRAIAHIEGEIARALRGRDAADQAAIDRTLIELDGTPNKSRLGANALLPVSMAVARAAAAARGVPLHEHLGGGEGTLLPVPEIQIIGGGAHAHWRTDVQDYLLIAMGARSYAECLEITHDVYHAAGDLLRARGASHGVADEGGHWPNFADNEAPLALLVEAIERAGYTPGREAALALDLAASEWFDADTGRYRLRREARELTSDELVAQWTDWCARYPIVSLEDPLADTDWGGWRKITAALGGRVQLVGDDLFTTRVERIRTGHARGVANAVLIKPNQVGTVTETLEAVHLTRQLGWQPIVSARSGETEDTFIAHLAVATNAGQLKVGALARGERTAKWNEVLRIARELGERARFTGFQPPRAV